MRTNAYKNYFENEILSADPLKLVVLLYRGAAEAVGSAQTHFATGDIRARSNSLTKAIEIIAELNRSLDMAKGGELSVNLAGLYDYMQELLLAANVQQSGERLPEVERLLNTLLEGWQGCEAALSGPTLVMPAARSFSQYGSEEDVQRVSYAG